MSNVVNIIDSNDTLHGNDTDNNLPPFHQRFDKLRPSRELLQFYRQKFLQYDSEYQVLCKKIEGYQCIQQELQKSQLENQQREDEIKQLQQALSDMQVFLFQEREHVLRLYADNDRLKIKDLESRKRIQHLLTLQGASGQGETTYMFKEPPSKVLVQQHHVRSGDLETSKGRGPGGHKKPLVSTAVVEEEPDKESLLLTIEALTAQLEEQSKLCKEQVDALLEDRKVKNEEVDARLNRDTEKIQCLSDQHHKSQCLLYESTKDFLQLKYEYRAKEREWMAEKDRLLQELDHMRDQMSTGLGKDSLLDFSCLENATPTSKRQASIVNYELQLQQTQQLADWYREQCIKCEDELARTREEGEVSKKLFAERTAKLSKRLQLMNSRYEALEKRRSLEVEGYQNDVRILRQKLKDLEKKLYKLTTTLSSSHHDLEMLTHVKETAATSKKVMDDLQKLKAKLYTIEKDFRNVHDH